MPFAHAVWMAMGLAYLALARQPVPPYAAAETAVMAGLPFLMLFFPAIVPALVIVVLQGLGILVHVTQLLDPEVMAALVEASHFASDPDGMKKAQLALFAHIAYRVVSIAAVLGCAFAYCWPKAPRRQRSYDHGILDLSAGGDYLQPWVRDADGHYRRG